MKSPYKSIVLFMKRHEVILYQTVWGSIIRLASSAIMWAFFGFLCLLISALISFNLANLYIYWATPIFILSFSISQFVNLIKQVRTHKNVRYSALKIIRSNIISLIIIFSVPYVLSIYFHLQEIKDGMQSRYGDYKDCDRWTEHMKGGYHSFNGHTFYIQICAKPVLSNQFSFRSNSIDEYKIRLAVFDEKGYFKALRYFTNSAETYAYFDFEEDKIEYFDIQNSMTPIHMPPSGLEWILSRLP